MSKKNLCFSANIASDHINDNLPVLQLTLLCSNTYSLKLKALIKKCRMTIKARIRAIVMLMYKLFL